MRTLQVGIMTAPHIEFVQPGPHSTKDRPTFLLKNVLIGIDFHWQRYEDQEFEGTLEIRKNADGTETAINHIPVEDYLSSVITSEMSAESDIELLKAHAVISRSWLLGPILNPAEKRIAVEDTPQRHVVWYERDAHIGFDVCADDHCQRYEGITRRDQHPEAAEKVRQAVLATQSMVLVDPSEQDRICDTRFSKSCGGKSELFENAWAPRHYKYLESVDCPYCNTHDKKVLSQVLNDYDQETRNFYRWEVQFTQKELSDLIREKSGIDFGAILAMNPIKRGPSYRIYELEIVGEKRTMIVGKELEIRKWLSKSCLYSSAFDVEAGEKDAKNIPNSFTLKGRGWGHGVGLCQIGAAVMASQGFTYEQILYHYFPTATLKRLQ